MFNGGGSWNGLDCQLIERHARVTLAAVERWRRPGIRNFVGDVTSTVMPTSAVDWTRQNGAANYGRADTTDRGLAATNFCRAAIERTRFRILSSANYPCVISSSSSSSSCGRPQWHHVVLRLSRSSNRSTPLRNSQVQIADTVIYECRPIAGRLVTSELITRRSTRARQSGFVFPTRLIIYNYIWQTILMTLHFVYSFYNIYLCYSG